MSNSSLVNYTRLSPNHSGARNHVIDTITIHHMAGNLSVETCGNVFANPSRQASSNYGIGSDGRVGMYVEECNRSWCTSSSSNDNRAVTIEVADDVIGGNWHVSDAALDKTIELCTDICRRNNIKRLNYTGDKSGNLTMHRWFAATSCPGEYLASKFPYIAAEVNKRLGSAASKPATSSGTKDLDTLAREVIAGKWGNGAERINRLSNAGYDANAVQSRVNAILAGKSTSTPTPTKSIDTLAQEVLNGAWGNGADRKARLEAAGYSYSAVQARVNVLLNTKASLKSIDTIAREVIAGKWGNGADRKARLTKAGYDYATVQARVNALLG